MKKYRIAVIVLLALFALGAAACLFSLAFASARGISRQGRMEKQAAFHLQVKEFQALRAELADWKKLPRELERFRTKHIISIEEYAAFRRDLNLCLDDNGFPAPDITMQFGAAPGRMRRVSFRFSISGPYYNMKKFIFAMEGKPRMHFFEHIELSGGSEKVLGRFAMEAYLEE